MFWHLYLRKGTIYVPTVAKTEAGYYIDIDPVDVFFFADLENLNRAIKRVINLGNPKVLTPTRNAFPKPVLLSYAKVNSWAAFEKDTDCWEICESKGFYQIKKVHKNETNEIENDQVKVATFPTYLGIDNVSQRISIFLQSTCDRSKSKKLTAKAKKMESEIGI